jgi:hypothetical protein
MPRFPRLALVLLAVAVAAAGCGLIPQPRSAMPACRAPAGDPYACQTIDGQPVGASGVDCKAVACAELQLALQGLRLRDPVDPTAVLVRRYDVDLTKECGPLICALTAQTWMYVLVRPDGVPRAVRIACPLGSCVLIDTRPG